jgi:hypothetical protein
VDSGGDDGVNARDGGSPAVEGGGEASSSSSSGSGGRRDRTSGPGDATDAGGVTEGCNTEGAGEGGEDGDGDATMEDADGEGDGEGEGEGEGPLQQLVQVRWCQQCGRLEKVSAFDGNRR